MKHTTFFIGAGVCIMLIGAGCSAASAPSTTNVSATQGLLSPNNDASVVAWVQDAKTTCQYADADGIADSYVGCPTEQKMMEGIAQLPTGFQTALNLLDDPQPMVRFLGATALSVGGFDDTAYANGADAHRVTEALQKETSPATAAVLGQVAMRFAWTNANNDDSLATVLKNRSLIAEGRQALFDNILSDHLQRQTLFDAIASVAADENDDPAIRATAIASLAKADSAHKEVAKAIVEPLMTSIQEPIATAAKQAADALK